MAMTLHPQTASTVLNLSHGREWDPGPLPLSACIMFYNEKSCSPVRWAAGCWAGKPKGVSGAGILPHGEPDVQW